MRMRDCPAVQVAEYLSCSPERAWALVTDIELPTRADGELQRVESLDGPARVAVGARFRGYNSNAQPGEWHTEPQIVEVEDGRRWAKLGAGPSPLNDVIEQHPDQESTILVSHMAMWRDGMAANLAVLKELVG